MTLPDQITLMEALLKENPDARVCDLWELMTSGKPVFFTRQSKMNEWAVEKPTRGRPEKSGKYLSTYKLPY